MNLSGNKRDFTKQLNTLIVPSLSQLQLSNSTQLPIPFGAETDPIFNAWDKSTGIIITQSQIQPPIAILVSQILDNSLLVKHAELPTISISTTGILESTYPGRELSGSNTGDQNIAGLVPYTGAIGDINLGVWKLIANRVQINNAPTLGTDATNKTYVDSVVTGGGPYQPQLNGSGYVKATGTTISYDNSVLDQNTGLRLDQTVPQSVLFGAPVFDAIDFAASPTSVGGVERRLRWNANDGTLDLGMQNGEITLQIGQENFVRVKNETGVLIENGKPVFFNGAASSGRPTIELLSNGPHVDCLSVAGITTEDIDTGAEGYVTTWGKVRNIDTSTLIEDALVYVGHDPGELTSSTPEDEHHTVVMGVCTKSDPVLGEIFVKRPIVIEPKELMETTGFHKVFEATISWDRVQREFTIEPIDPANGFSFYQLGVQYLKHTAETVQIDDIEGIHYVFYNLGVLSSANNLTKDQVVYAIENYAIVAQIYWDATNKEELILGEERHGFVMDGETHAYLHMVFGPQWLEGMALNTITASGDGSSNAHAQFGVDSGEFFDDDLDLHTDPVVSTAGLPIFCYDGINADLRRYLEPGFPVLTDTTAGLPGPTGRLVYNKYAGGSWSLEVVPDDNFVLYHVFSTNDPDQPYISVIGTTYYATLLAAQIGAESEITPIAANSIKQEFLPVATVAFQTNSAYANDVKAKIVESIPGSTYSDWRVTRSIAAVSVPGDHNDLSGKDGGGPNEYYHLTNADYTRAITAASAIADGYLTSANFSLFNGKQDGNANLTSLALLTYASTSFVKMTAANTFALDTTTYSPSTHVHGNITNAGLVGVTANLPLHTGVGGIVEVGAFGTAANQFCQGNDLRLSDNRTPLAHNLIDTVGHTVTGLVAGQIIKATGTAAYAFGYDTQYNASIQVQTGFATDTYLIGSSIAIPNSSLKVNSRYKLKFAMTKTAAGTASLIIRVRFGTGGSTGDTALLTFTAPTAQTAHIDTAIFDVDVTFRTVGAGTNAVIAGRVSSGKDNTTANRGHFTVAAYVAQAVSAGFDSTVSNSIIGVSYNGGTNYVGTCELVAAQLENLV